MRERNKRILNILKKNLRLKTLISFILILVFNTYAWFIYVSEVSTDITTHVKSWEIDFGSDIVQEIDFNVGEIYPGMTTVTQTVDISNNGEVTARVVFEISEITILGTTYTVTDNVTTSQDLIDMIANDYPFSFKVYMNGVETSLLNITNGEECEVVMEVAWTFESESEDEAVAAAKDAADTYWGNEAYTYLQEHSTDNPVPDCIAISARIKAEQVQEQVQEPAGE